MNDATSAMHTVAASITSIGKVVESIEDVEFDLAKYRLSIQLRRPAMTIESNDLTESALGVPANTMTRDAQLRIIEYAADRVSVAALTTFPGDALSPALPGLSGRVLLVNSAAIDDAASSTIAKDNLASRHETTASGVPSPTTAPLLSYLWRLLHTDVFGLLLRSQIKRGLRKNVLRVRMRRGTHLVEVISDGMTESELDEIALQITQGHAEIQLRSKNGAE